MPKRLSLVILMLFWNVATTAMAEEKPASEPMPEDQKVIAVLEILEIMEMLDDISLFEDMEYLTEGDSNEPQK